MLMMRPPSVMCRAASWGAAKTARTSMAQRRLSRNCEIWCASRSSRQHSVPGPAQYPGRPLIRWLPAGPELHERTGYPGRAAGRAGRCGLWMVPPRRAGCGYRTGQAIARWRAPMALSRLWLGGPQVQFQVGLVAAVVQVPTQPGEQLGEDGLDDAGPLLVQGPALGGVQPGGHLLPRMHHGGGGVAFGAAAGLPGFADDGDVQLGLAAGGEVASLAYPLSHRALRIGLLIPAAASTARALPSSGSRAPVSPGLSWVPMARITWPLQARADRTPRTVRTPRKPGRHAAHSCT
jgi:hypothetical protein